MVRYVRGWITPPSPGRVMTLAELVQSFEQEISDVEVASEALAAKMAELEELQAQVSEAEGEVAMQRAEAAAAIATLEAAIEAKKVELGLTEEPVE